MPHRKTPNSRPALAGWLQELLRGPVAPTGDYFLRLHDNVAASAPECSPCG